MVKLLIGHKGSGKTKKMIEMANSSLNSVNGSVVYINKSNLSRPVIQLDNGEIINLADSVNNKLFIKSIL